MALVEEWRNVMGFDGQYEISSLGAVRSLPRLRRGARGIPTRVAGRILRQANCNGYRGVSLGKGRFKHVHRLVAEAFIPNPSGLPEVNHIDGDKANNCQQNLEWVSHRDNCRHAATIGLFATGLRHGRHTKPEAFYVRY